MRSWLIGVMGLAAIGGCDKRPLSRDCTGQEDEILFNQRDDDCNEKIDEGRWDSRVHCGQAHLQCILEPGAADVACRGGACVPIDPGTQTFEMSCLDGIDDDHNGVVDDGPLCEVLIANVSSPECHGEVGAPGCPPTAISIGEGAGYSVIAPTSRSDEGPRHVVHFKHDILVDRHEVSRAQFGRYLEAAGRCGEAPHPGCDVPPEARALPASAASWCDAYAYCRWAGKRLLTEAEWERMAAGTHGKTGLEFPWTGLPVTAPNDGSGVGPPVPFCTASVCEADCKRVAAVTVTCFPSEAPHLLPVDHVGGGRLVGDIHNGGGASTYVLNIGGNVWEWVYDAFENYPIGPDGEPVEGPATVRPGVGGQARVVRGGGVFNPLDSTETSNRTYAPPLGEVDGYGIRCGRSFRGVEPPYPLTPVNEQPACPPPSADCARPVEADALLVAIDSCSSDLPETGFGPAVSSVLRSDLAGRNPVTIAIDTGGVTLGLAALQGADRICWSKHSSPISRPGVGCPAPDCRVEGFSPSRLVIAPILGDPELKLFVEVEHLAEAPVDERTCGRPGMPGERRFRLQGVITHDSPFEFADKTLGEAMCDELSIPCGTMVANCATDCPGWRVGFDLLVIPHPQRD